MGDVNKLTKEEFLKFLNCSLLQNNSIEKITITGPKNVQFTLLKRYGKFKAKEVTLEEASLNNKVLRINFPRINLLGLEAKQVATLFRSGPKKNLVFNRKFSRFGRRIIKKKTLYEAKPSMIRTRNFNENKVNGMFKKANGTANGESFLYSSKRDQTLVNCYDGKGRFDQQENYLKKYGNLPFNEPSYYLSFSSSKYPEDGKLNYSFESLVTDVKNMSLPSPTWKIKVVVRKNKISAIIFTNKCELERCVSFTAKSDRFLIMIDNKPALLLGSPPTVNSVDDIEVLLSIVHSINPKNPMILYK